MFDTRYEVFDTCCCDLVDEPGLVAYRLAVEAPGDGVVENDVGQGVLRAKALRSAGLMLEVRGAPFALTLDALDGVGTVVLENVDAHQLGEPALRTLASYVEQAGGGLVMTGGRSSFGARRSHFELGRAPTSISRGAVDLDDGRAVAADLVVLGVGVRPNVTLAEAAGCEVDRGVLVNAYLETTVPGIWAAGDVARWFDGRARRSARVEHWVVAARLGQMAAKNILGKREPFRFVPFFWSQHYDVPIAYVGNGEGWESAEVKGSLQERNALVVYRRAGKIVAVASIYRDRDSLLAEDTLERGDDVTLERLAASVQG